MKRKAGPALGRSGEPSSRLPTTMAGVVVPVYEVELKKGLYASAASSSIVASSFVTSPPLDGATLELGSIPLAALVPLAENALAVESAADDLLAPADELEPELELEPPELDASDRNEDR